MNRDDIAGKLARRARVSRATAADELDRVVNRILKNLREGEPSPLPGLGTFLPGPAKQFRFEQRTKNARKP